METLNSDGLPLWLAPDGIFEKAQSSASRTGDSITVQICITNQGDAAMGKPVYVTVYRDYIHPDSIIKIDSLNGYIDPGSTACLNVGVSDIKPKLPFTRLIVRLNDNSIKYPVLPECNYGDSIMLFINPALDLMMKKDAAINAVHMNGTYPNPASVLYNEKIRYEITAINANLVAGAVFIIDTLPPYLNYVGGSAGGDVGYSSLDTTLEMPPREVLSWEFTAPLPNPYDTLKVWYEATPENGVSASQPMYINYAWVNVSDSLDVTTNKTYHQGAGIAVVLFSASSGGSIYHAGEQALDYMTSPRSGILVVPDEGYRFAGWRHDDYMSLRGKVIRADSGIMRCDTLVIYGNVELHAVFEPEGLEEISRVIEEPEKPQKEDKIWSSEDVLYVRTYKSGSIARIYKPDGMLYDQRTVITEGTTEIKLPRGIYIVTLNNGIGQKVLIN
jgi:uncharacterized repeat protein (TIGR01451 family)